jgi:hypothetical protein
MSYMIAQPDRYEYQYIKSFTLLTNAEKCKLEVQLSSQAENLSSVQLVANLHVIIHVIQDRS